VYAFNFGDGATLIRWGKELGLGNANASKYRKVVTFRRKVCDSTDENGLG